MPVLPDPRTAGERAAQILDVIKADDEYDRLVDSSLLYSDCWKCAANGFVVITEWDETKDSPHLLAEALKALALKAAVYEATNDERLAELLVAGPVDEMVHAVLAQTGLMTRIAGRLGVTWVHMTDCESYGYEPGGYTDQAYEAAGFGEMDRRYWLSSTEALRRSAQLDKRYVSIGFRAGGRSHTFNFAQPVIA
jgi:hypothetical protein